MGEPKALLDCHGETFLDRIIGTFAACCDPVIVVLGHQAAGIRGRLARQGQAVFAVNPSPDLGMLSSLQAGLAAVPSDARSVFFHPCDMPLVQIETLRLLLAALSNAAPEILAAVPTLEGKRGHPVLIRSTWIPDFLALSRGATVRTLLDAFPASVVEAPVQDPGVRRDFDTRDEYEATFGATP
jgi:molybdenum cofactor cytidylyltransferase